MAFLKSVLASGCLTLSATAMAQLPDAPPLNLQLDNITVSGLSSGGYMATQYHLANSDRVTGAAIISAGPYYCGQNDITTALSQCVNKTDAPIDLPALSARASEWAAEGKLPSLDNLKGSKVWLLHGTLDTKITRQAADLLAQQYREWAGEDAVRYISDKPFAHLFPTQDKGTDCMTSEAPFIGNCDYDAAGELLTFLLDDLTPPDDTQTGALMQFNQTRLAGENGKTLAELGYVYVPENCAEGDACRVHISFHGCNQYAGAVGTAYAEQTGLNRWADDNSLVVVYPQTRKSLFMPLNPQGCWDWWGYTGDNYATKDGVQIKAITAIVNGLNHVNIKDN
ncbi:extracellular catalytic domain type 2 short-chain-length polyhydroxyalkanoate depolymerase [Alteromonas sp. CYL-A6]|uniref:extracellular catalytic domain type 2 short-chain-length polyhydroxyalkanoate depolymerase n=1 Tax=Alteromonas nitratireducens TaxID=3390813 RepID=UPI0034AC002F